MGAPRSGKRKGFPPNLYQQANGYFYYRNPQNGKIKGLGRDKPKAMQEARAANAALANLTQSDLVAWVSGIEPCSLSEWLDQYLPLWIESEKPVASTQNIAKRYLNRIKQAEFAWMQVADITTRHVASYLDAIEKDSVAVNLRTRLHDVFRMAEVKGLIKSGHNPVSATKPRGYEVKRERLSLEQFLAIKEKVSKPVANAMMLALLTGQRISDVANMQFADYRDGYLFIVQGKTGHKLQQDGRIRLEAVGMSIDDAIKQCRDRVISKYLVHHNRTSGNYKAGDKMSVFGLSDAFKTARAAVGIQASEGKTPPSFHEIRSLAERLYRKEYGQEFSQQIMGHKHAKMTAEYSDMRGSGWAVVTVK